jgi:hypothetical protein
VRILFELIRFLARLAVPTAVALIVFGFALSG